MTAIFSRLFNAILSLLSFSDVNACDFHKNTPFISAAANGDITTLKLLLDHKNCNLLARNFEGHTALHRACFFGEIETVDFLLRHTELKVGDRDKKGNNCVHLACMGLSITLSRYLMLKVKNSAGLLVPNKEGKTPLIIVVETVKSVSPTQNIEELHL